MADLISSVFFPLLGKSTKAQDSHGWKAVFWGDPLLSYPELNLCGLFWQVHSLTWPPPKSLLPAPQ
jgi:hypothetical protein